jgi:hypothetical protein
MSRAENPDRTPSSTVESIASRLLVPVGNWRVNVKSTFGQVAIRLSGRTSSDSAQLPGGHAFVLTPDQAQELISGLNRALVEVEQHQAANLARAAALARAAERTAQLSAQSDDESYARTTNRVATKTFDNYVGES